MACGRLYAVVLLLPLLAGPILGGTHGGWDDPPGGWDYMYEAAAGDATFVDRADAGEVGGLLDGSWSGTDTGYFWDGSIPGQFDAALATGFAPGGVELKNLAGLGEGGTLATVLSLEVVGDTTDATQNPFNFAWASPANEAVYFFHPTSRPWTTGNQSTKKGVTVIARWRLKPDPQDVVPPAGKNYDGQGFSSGGRGMLSIVDQNDVNASLSITDEGKLILMDMYELPLPGAPTDFVTTWFAVCESDRDSYGYTVDVYINGSATPAFSEEVTTKKGDDEDSSIDDYVGFGLPLAGVSGAMELDYFGYKIGFVRPGEGAIPPLTLTCSGDNGTLDMTWTLHPDQTDPYDSIEIVMWERGDHGEGTVIATLAGDATTYTTDEIPEGNYEFAVRPIVGGKALQGIHCWTGVECPTGDADVVIDHDRNPPAAHITWNAPNIEVDHIEVARDQRGALPPHVVVDNLPATATEYVDTALRSYHGECRYEVTFVPVEGDTCGPALTGYVVIPRPEKPYLEPDGGWDYVYNPDDHVPIANPMDQYVAQKGVAGNLDGTWIRSNGIDYWDGSAPGEITAAPNGMSPGGVEILDRPGQGLGGTTIKTISFEDTGDPRDLDPAYAEPSNRKIYLGTLLDPAVDAVDGGRLSQGVALYARFRITPDPKDVQNPPNGQPVRADRGQITLDYFDGDSGADVGNGSKSWGMSLDGDALQFTDGGDINGLKPGEWVSVWFTTEDVDGSGFYHSQLFMNGDTVPIRPDWRSELDSWEENLITDRTVPWTALLMGMLHTDEDGAIEVDFVKVKYAEIFPASATIVPGVTGLTCHATGSNATVTWTNEGTYDRIDVVGTDGTDTVTAALFNRETQAAFTNLADGDWTFTVTVQNQGILGDQDATCTATLPGTGGEELFYRGEINQDGSINVADAVYLLQHIFMAGPAPQCLDSVDTNDDGRMNVADAVYLLMWIFASGPDMPPPNNEVCGPDPTPDDLPGPCIFTQCGP